MCSLAASPWIAPALEAPSKLCVRGDSNGVSTLLDLAMQDRTKRLSRLGNAVVPDCAEWIARQLYRAARSA